MQSSQFNPHIDDYIADAEAFAQPILTHLRFILHEVCPGIEEKIRWSLPHFDYHGEMLCVFAAATKHCSFTFLKQPIMSDPRLRRNPELPAAKRFLGKLTSLDDLPSDEELTGFIREAMTLNEKGVQVPPRPAAAPKQIDMHEAFAVALAKNPDVQEIFESKSNAFRKDYLVWVQDAKTDATRQKRIDESLAWIAAGKGRFWKYKK